MTERGKAEAALVLLTDGTLAASAAALELQYPGAGVALAATAPLLARLNERAWARVFRIAQLQSGLSPVDIIARLGEVENGVRLLSLTVEAVRVAPYEEKLRVLGRSLAIGAQDQTLIDEELLVVTAVSAIEPYHLRLLRAATASAAEGNGDWHTKFVDKIDPGLTPDVAEMLVGTLVGMGAVARHTAVGYPAYSNTRLGTLLLERAAAFDD